MTKTFAYISSVVAVLGLTAGVVFNLLDFKTFGLLSTSVVATIFAIYKDYETKALKVKQSKLESKVLDLELSNEKLTRFNKDLNEAVKVANFKVGELEAQKKTVEVKIEPVITKQDELEVVTTKRKRK